MTAGTVGVTFTVEARCDPGSWQEYEGIDCNLDKMLDGGDCVYFERAGR